MGMGATDRWVARIGATYRTVALWRFRSTTMRECEGLHPSSHFSQRREGATAGGIEDLDSTGLLTEGPQNRSHDFNCGTADLAPSRAFSEALREVLEAGPSEVPARSGEVQVIRRSTGDTRSQPGRLRNLFVAPQYDPARAEAPAGDGSRSVFRSTARCRRSWK